MEDGRVGVPERRIVVALLALLVPIMLAASFCRHVLPEHHPALVRMAAGCLTWLVSFGMSLAAAEGLHTRVSCFVELVRPDTARRLEAVAEYGFLVFAFFSLVVGVCVVLAQASRHGFGEGVVIYSSIPLGSVFTMVRLVERRRRRAREGTAE